MNTLPTLPDILFAAAAKTCGKGHDFGPILALSLSLSLSLSLLTLHSSLSSVFGAAKAFSFACLSLVAPFFLYRSIKRRTQPGALWRGVEKDGVTRERTARERASAAPEKKLRVL